MAGVLSTFSFATSITIQQLKNRSNNENTVKSIAFLVDGLELVVFRGGNFQGNRKLRADAAYHFTRAILRRNKKKKANKHG